MSSGPTPDPQPQPDPKPDETPDPLAALVDKLASFDPTDFERRLQELADSIQLPDLAAVLAPIEERLGTLEASFGSFVKDIRKLLRGAPSSGTGGGPAPPDPGASGTGNGEGAEGAPQGGSPPTGRFSEIFGGVPHIDT